MKQKIYYDTEFIEGTQDKRFLGIKYGKTNPTIDLISIGLKHEDGRQYYAISKDFNITEAWNRYDVAPQTMFEKTHDFEGKRVYWIRENVLRPIFNELDDAYVKRYDYSDNSFNLRGLKRLIKKYGKTNKQIAQDIKEFTCPLIKIMDYDGLLDEGYNIYMRQHPIDLYGYYCSYDHVCLCCLFGKMIDLPAGFPMFTIDLKQKLDSLYTLQYQKHEGESRLESFLKTVKNHPRYPLQSGEHNALNDANWNKDLHDFINHLENYGIDYDSPSQTNIAP